MEKNWSALEEHYGRLQTSQLTDLFEENPDRFNKFSVSLDDMLLDYSKTSVDQTAFDLLLDLARQAAVEQKRDDMFSGKLINGTEGRAALHTALRNRTGEPVYVNGEDVMPGVRSTLDAMKSFAGQIRSGEITASDGEPFTEIVNIGIGGSDLGPAMATLALAPYHDGPRCHFISNVDSAQITDLLKVLDPGRTLFLISSKTFTTLETMTNATTAKAWIRQAIGDKTDQHFAAVSTSLERTSAFGIRRDYVFGFEDWVGGRYSVWGPIGLSLMIAIGSDAFMAFLQGGADMDDHFQTAPLSENMPVILGFIGIWHNNICGYASRAVLPYDQRLARLPAYLQQLDMESNGKRISQDGSLIMQDTGPVVWGEPGTNGQHAFYQLLHQGSRIVPCEFLVAAQSHEPELGRHQQLLLANCLAQSEALMTGRTHSDPYRNFPGNRPSTTLIYRKLSPRTLGRIIALYEHRVFVEGAIWGLNSFDQWGVELGKELASNLLPLIESGNEFDGKDGSTSGLLARITELREPEE